MCQLRRCISAVVRRRRSHDIADFVPHIPVFPCVSYCGLCLLVLQVVRGFQSGRREFRTLHAMYRSETGGAPPYHGLHQDTDAWPILGARASKVGWQGI